MNVQWSNLVVFFSTSLSQNSDRTYENKKSFLLFYKTKIKIFQCSIFIYKTVFFDENFLFSFQKRYALESDHKKLYKKTRTEKRKYVFWWFLTTTKNHDDGEQEKK